MAQLDTFTKLAAEDQRTRSRVQWMKIGDGCTKEFFKTARPYSGASCISELEDKQRISTNQVGLERICAIWLPIQGPSMLSLPRSSPNICPRRQTQRQHEVRPQ
jgi:hypothetical protein